MKTLGDRIEGGIYGLLIGDALGVPYEFHEPEAIPEPDRTARARSGGSGDRKIVRAPVGVIEEASTSGERALYILMHGLSPCHPCIMIRQDSSRMVMSHALYYSL
jgi:hypothetical protein